MSHNTPTKRPWVACKKSRPFRPRQSSLKVNSNSLRTWQDGLHEREDVQSEFRNCNQPPAPPPKRHDRSIVPPVSASTLGRLRTLGYCRSFLSSASEIRSKSVCSMFHDGDGTVTVLTAAKCYLGIVVVGQMLEFGRSQVQRQFNVSQRPGEYGILLDAREKGM